jgi:cell division protein FtsQ
MSDAPGTGAAPGATPAAGASSGTRPGPATGLTPAEGWPAVSWPGGPGTGGRGGGPGRPPGAPRRRARRRHSRWRAAFFALAGLAIVAGVVWALIGNRLLVVRSVSVTGTRLLTPAQVIAAADVPLGTPLLSVDAQAVTRRVEAIRQVASASVSEDWPDHLVITVTERVPVMALRMSGGGYDLVDRDGVIVRYAQARPAALPRLVTSLSGSALNGNPGATTAAAVLAELQSSLARQVAAVEPTAVASGTEQITLGLQDGRTIVWGGTDNAAQKNRELAILLPGGAQQIDVSSPGTVVTR